MYGTAAKVINASLSQPNHIEPIEVVLCTQNLSGKRTPGQAGIKKACEYMRTTCKTLTALALTSSLFSNEALILK